MPFSIEKESTSNSGCSQTISKQPHILPSTRARSCEKQNRDYGTTKILHDDGITEVITKLNLQTSESIQRLAGAYFPKHDTEMTAFTSKRQPAALNLESHSSNAIDSSPSSTDASGDTSGWADSVSSHNISPSNLISLSESPLNLGTNGRQSNLGWTAKEQRNYPFRNPSSVSPTTSRRGLSSYQFDESQNSDIYSSQASHLNARRGSTYSQPRNNPNPPLPHQIQAHFFGVPKADLILAHQVSAANLYESDYHCGFDILLKENVITIGYESGLEVYSISKRGLSRSSRLEGLRGGVYNAKIIPWSANQQNTGPFPLVALVVYGPANITSEASDTALVSEDVMASYSSAMQSSSCRANINDIEYYQTTVELYSLSGSKRYVETLLSLPKIPLIMARKNLQVKELVILADCGNLVITSGKTGETWIFKQTNSEELLNRQFMCIGKVWTTVQRGVTLEGATERVTDCQKKESLFGRKQLNTPILSLNGRWLAYCPSTPSSQSYLRANVANSSQAVKIPGLATQTPPHLPEVNCGTESPGVESVMKQIVQVGTQNFIRASNYLAQQGLQAWTNYRNKPTSTLQKTSITQTFPPLSASSVTKDPGLVSVIDLSMLTQNDTNSNLSLLHPNFTFRMPHGCSFLSFSPSGLSLFTASSKGDVQFVWDLMQMRNIKIPLSISDHISTGSQGPHVRQIAQFSRMTIARIVDVVWASPHGERVAMVTEPGTIHVLDLPSSAFKWPPPGNRTLNSEVEHPIIQNNGSTASATGVATSAVNTLWTAARPLVSTRRRSSTCLSARSVTITAGHSTQALAAGISRSVGAATEKMNEIRKSVGNKLHLPRSSAAPSRACVILLNKKRSDVIFAVANGIIRVYTIGNRRADRPADKQRMSVKCFVEYKIPLPPNPKFSSNARNEMNSDKHLDFTEAEIHEIGQKLRQTSLSYRFNPSVGSSIPHAEIESNAPHQPFHTLKCVSLYTYSDHAGHLPRSSLNSSLNDETEMSCTTDTKVKNTWVFGGPILTTRIDVGLSNKSESKIEQLNASRALSSSAIESIMKVSDNTDGSEHIIVTTKRRKASRPNIEGMTNEYGFFEDDCEMLDFANLKR